MIIHQVRSFRDKYNPLHYRFVDVPPFTLLLYNLPPPVPRDNMAPTCNNPAYELGDISEMVI